MLLLDQYPLASYVAETVPEALLEAFSVSWRYGKIGVPEPTVKGALLIFNSPVQINPLVTLDDARDLVLVRHKINLSDWGSDYGENALRKMCLTRRTGLPAHIAIAQCGLILDAEETRYGGSAIHLPTMTIVGFSGQNERIDYLIAEAVLVSLIGLGNILTHAQRRATEGTATFNRRTFPAPPS